MFTEGKEYSWRALEKTKRNESGRPVKEDIDGQPLGTKNGRPDIDPSQVLSWKPGVNCGFSNAGNRGEYEEESKVLVNVSKFVPWNLIKG